MRANNPKLPILFLLATLITSACDQKGYAQKNEHQIASQQVQPASPQTLEKVKTEALEYSPTVVELEGRLTTKTFFGPPNFGENPETDSKEECWILSLDRPISVRAKTGSDPIFWPSADNVPELQLVLEGTHRKLIGKRVLVKGTLFPADNGHHHTAVLLDVESINAAPKD